MAQSVHRPRRRNLIFVRIFIAALCASRANQSERRAKTENVRIEFEKELRFIASRIFKSPSLRPENKARRFPWPMKGRKEFHISA